MHICEKVFSRIVGYFLCNNRFFSLGARFAAHQSKVGLIKIIRNYKVEPCEKTQIPYIESPKHPFLLAPKDGIYLKVTKIKI